MASLAEEMIATGLANKLTGTPIHGGTKALCKACDDGDFTWVCTLLGYGVDPNGSDEHNKGFTPLMRVAAFGHKRKLLHALIDMAPDNTNGAGLDINAVSSNKGWEGRTALDFAIECGKRKSVIKILRKHGALRAADFPQKKRPKSATKKGYGGGGSGKPAAKKAKT